MIRLTILRNRTMQSRPHLILRFDGSAARSHHLVQQCGVMMVLNVKTTHSRLFIRRRVRANLPIERALAKPAFAVPGFFGSIR